MSEMPVFERFEAIANQTIAKAEKIRCSLREFREGLDTIIERLNDRLEQVDDELLDLEEFEGSESED